MKIILKKEHLEELERILDTYLSAHSRANWDNEEARKIIINLIMSKFRKAIGILYGLHRLMKSYIEKYPEIKTHILPRSKIPLIKKPD
jgi:hypothetical protein